MDLNTAWFLLIWVLLIGYAVLDGSTWALAFYTFSPRAMLSGRLT